MNYGLNMEESRINDILDFLTGKMNAEEKAKVEQKILNDPDFAREIADYQKILKGLNAHHADHLKSQMTTWEANINQSKLSLSHKSNNILRIVRYAAAAVLVLVAVTLVFQYTSNKASEQVSKQDLFAENYKTPKDRITLRGIENTNNHIVAGMKAYNQKNFKTAATELQSYYSSNPDSIQIGFYLAISQLEDNQAELAISTFKALGTKATNQEYESSVKYYLALAYIKANKKAEAKDVLIQLLQSKSSDFKTEAQNILKNL